jgi:uncharacterized protein
MRIAVVSDTHLPRFGDALPRALRVGIAQARVDLIVHLGDFTGSDVPRLLEDLGPLEAVAGNNDPPELAERFGRRGIVSAAGLRLGLTHGDLGPGRSTLERAVRHFPATDADLVLFGHSHIPLVVRLPDGRWAVNPGSPTDKRRQARYSWAVIDVDDAGVATPRLHWFDDRRA